ncbi:MAG: hypothetical protein WCO93_06055 [bacterium]
MSHHEKLTENLSHEELKFREHTERAGHFIKIDLFRSAREEYKAALTYRSSDTYCLKQIDAMNAQIAKDRQVVLVVVPFVLALIAAIIIFG